MGIGSGRTEPTSAANAGLGLASAGSEGLPISGLNARSEGLGRHFPHRGFQIVSGRSRRSGQNSMMCRVPKLAAGEELSQDEVMSKPADVQPYRWLAEHFDRVFGGHRGFIEAAHRAIVEPILPQVRVACDLACGTGTTALGLAARGIRMYGVDLSPGMCRAARRKAREQKLALRVIQADMRDFRLPESADLILCEYDAINHVSRHSDLRRVSLSVARALNPGGWFFFDVNNVAGFDKYWRGTWWVETWNYSRYEKRPQSETPQGLV